MHTKVFFLLVADNQITDTGVADNQITDTGK
jgi:hypothetical protein